MEQDDVTNGEGGKVIRGNFSHDSRGSSDRMELGSDEVESNDSFRTKLGSDEVESNDSLPGCHFILQTTPETSRRITDLEKQVDELRRPNSVGFVRNLTNKSCALLLLSVIGVAGLEGIFKIEEFDKCLAERTQRYKKEKDEDRTNYCFGSVIPKSTGDLREDFDGVRRMVAEKIEPEDKPKGKNVIERKEKSRKKEK